MTADDDEGEGGGGRLSVETRSRSFNWLVVRSAGEHWSFGGRGGVRSSTFDNTELDVEVSPAVEWNFFPYSMYTRRQLRVEYSVGGVFRRYYEETLLGNLEETRGRQQISGTYEQREEWGTLQASLVFSNYFPGLSTNRVSVEGEANIRIVRGLSLSLDASASRIRDQLALPRRDATPEEVLLRLRQLSSGFETRAEIGLTYQFGSRFAGHRQSALRSVRRTRFAKRSPASDGSPALVMSPAREASPLTQPHIATAPTGSHAARS